MAGDAWRVPRIWLVSIGASAAVFAVTAGAQWFVYLFLLGEAGLRIIGPAVAAIATGLAVFKEQQLEEQRENDDLRRFRIIAETNHHVRNALQILVYQNPPADQKAAEMLQEAAHRIEWVLTDILPGVRDNASKLDSCRK